MTDAISLATLAIAKYSTGEMGISLTKERECQNLFRKNKYDTRDRQRKGGEAGEVDIKSFRR